MALALPIDGKEDIPSKYAEKGKATEGTDLLHGHELLKRAPAGRSSSYEHHLDPNVDGIESFDGNASSDDGSGSSSSSSSAARQAAVEAGQARKRYIKKMRQMGTSLSQLRANQNFVEEIHARHEQDREWNQMPEYAHDRGSYEREQRRASLAADELIQRVGNGESLEMHGCLDKEANNLVMQFNDQISQLRSLIRQGLGQGTAYLGPEQGRPNIVQSIQDLAWQASFTKQQLHIRYIKMYRNVENSRQG